MINPDLSKLKCPECGSTYGFEMSVVCNAEFTDDGIPDILLGSWNLPDGATCYCNECSLDAPVAEFLGEPPVEPVAEPAPSASFVEFAQAIAGLQKWEPGSPEEPSDGMEDSHVALMDLIDQARALMTNQSDAPADDVPPPEQAPQLYCGVSEDGEVLGDWDERLRSAGCRAVLKA